LAVDLEDVDVGVILVVQKTREPDGLSRNTFKLVVLVVDLDKSVEDAVSGKLASVVLSVEEAGGAALVSKETEVAETPATIGEVVLAGGAKSEVAIVTGVVELELNIIVLVVTGKDELEDSQTVGLNLEVLTVSIDHEKSELDSKSTVGSKVGVSSGEGDTISEEAENVSAIKGVCLLGALVARPEARVSKTGAEKIENNAVETTIGVCAKIEDLAIDTDDVLIVVEVTSKDSGEPVRLSGVSTEGSTNVFKVEVDEAQWNRSI